MYPLGLLTETSVLARDTSLLVVCTSKPYELDLADEV